MNSREDFLQKWDKSAKDSNIPESALNPRVRVLQGEDDYSFGVIFNPHRFQRPMRKMDADSCVLCEVVEDTKAGRNVSLDSENVLKDNIVVANKFPTMRGHGLILNSGTGKNEKPMYSTRNVNGLSQEIRKVMEFAGDRGLQAYHNSVGAGASIPGHEHWHLTNWKETYQRAGQVYGFDRASVESSGLVSAVMVMPEFPFAHLIFESDEVERLPKFLERLQEKIGSQYDERGVPHVLCQSAHGIVVVPFKKYNTVGGIGSGDVAGHLVLKDENVFNSMSYEDGINKLGESLFRKEDINLEFLL